MLGGGYAQNVAMIPSDHRYERCIFTKNPAWKSGMQYPPQVKCHLEVKFAKRVLVTGCLFEHNWSGASMAGASITIKVCSNTTSVDDSWITTEDVTLEHNLVRKVGRFLSVVGSNDGAGTTQQMRAAARPQQPRTHHRHRRVDRQRRERHRQQLAGGVGVRAQHDPRLRHWPADVLPGRHARSARRADGLPRLASPGTGATASRGLVAWARPALDKDIGPGKYLFGGNVLKEASGAHESLPPRQPGAPRIAVHRVAGRGLLPSSPAPPAAAVTTTDGGCPASCCRSSANVAEDSTVPYP